MALSNASKVAPNMLWCIDEQACIFPVKAVDIDEDQKTSEGPWGTEGKYCNASVGQPTYVDTTVWNVSNIYRKSPLSVLLAKLY